MTIIPSKGNTQQQQQHQPPSSSSAPPHQAPPGEEEEEAPTPASDSLQQLFTALSACADLHPDPASDSDLDIDGDGADPDYLSTGADTDAMYTQIDGLPPPMPGSGGWITAENVGEFFDEEGNFRGGGRLGEGAGSVRGREEEDAEDVNGDGRDGEGNGGDEGGKWRGAGGGGMVLGSVGWRGGRLRGRGLRRRRMREVDVVAADPKHTNSSPSARNHL